MNKYISIHFNLTAIELFSLASDQAPNYFCQSAPEARLHKKSVRAPWALKLIPHARSDPWLSRKSFPWWVTSGAMNNTMIRQGVS